jgi:hypothetical protein
MDPSRTVVVVVVVVVTLSLRTPHDVSVAEACVAALTFLPPALVAEVTVSCAAAPGYEKHRVDILSRAARAARAPLARRIPAVEPGKPRAVNAAVASALRRRADATHIFLIDGDVEIRRGTLEACLEASAMGFDLVCPQQEGDCRHLFPGAGTMRLEAVEGRGVLQTCDAYPGAAGGCSLASLRAWAAGGGAGGAGGYRDVPQGGGEDTIFVHDVYSAGMRAAVCGWALVYHPYRPSGTGRSAKSPAHSLSGRLARQAWPPRVRCVQACVQACVQTSARPAGA